MKSQQIMNMVKSKNIVLPLYLYKIYPKLDIDMEQFIFLTYLYNQGTKILFNPNLIMEDLGLDINQIMNYIGKLTDKKLINLEVCKNDKGIMEEYISLEGFFGKLEMLFIDNINNEETDCTSIFAIIEKEFARTLSPIEYEIIKAWIDSGTSEEVIKEALKEATFNGVSNLRYIDKILYEWNKKGIKSSADVNKSREQFNNKKSEKVNVFEYDWLEDEE